MVCVTPIILPGKRHHQASVLQVPLSVYHHLCHTLRGGRRAVRHVSAQLDHDVNSLPAISLPVLYSMYWGGPSKEEPSQTDGTFPGSSLHLLPFLYWGGQSMISSPVCSRCFAVSTSEWRISKKSMASRSCCLPAVSLFLHCFLYCLFLHTPLEPHSF